jgi:hypothetical protein
MEDCSAITASEKEEEGKERKRRWQKEEMIFNVHY